MFRIDLELFEKKIKSKFSIIWPSAKSTPPTEANIATTFTEIYAGRYNIYSEVPIEGGRIDLVLVDQSQKEIVFCEFKSSKVDSLQEIKADIDRLMQINVKCLYFYSGEIPQESRRLIFQWSENKVEVDENIEKLSEKYNRIEFRKCVIDCNGASLFCLFALW